MASAGDGAISSMGWDKAGMTGGNGPSEAVGAGDGAGGCGVYAGGITGAGALGCNDETDGGTTMIGDGAFGLDVAGVNPVAGGSGPLGVNDPSGRSLSGRGGGMGVGRAGTEAGSIVRRKAGTGGIGAGGGIMGRGARMGASGAGFTGSSTAASGSACRSNGGGDAGLGAGTWPRVCKGNGATASRRGITILEGLTCPWPKL